VLEALTQFQTALTECHRIVTLSPMDGLVEFDNVPICLEMMRDGVGELQRVVAAEL
jgi:hypothetical protein